MVPKDAESFWLPTDLAGIVAATYRPSTRDLQAVVGPACTSMRTVIKELGCRANRFRLQYQTPQSARYESLRGTWQGCTEQRSGGKKGLLGTATLTIHLTPTAEGIYTFRDTPETTMHVTGSFHHDRFVRLDYSNSQGRAMQFGCATLELNAPGDKMEGEYVGYGAWSECVVSGTIAVSSI